MNITILKIKKKKKLNHFVNAKIKLRKELIKLANKNKKIFIWLRIFMFMDLCKEKLFNIIFN